MHTDMQSTGMSAGRAAMTGTSKARYENVVVVESVDKMILKVRRLT